MGRAKKSEYVIRPPSTPNLDAFLAEPRKRYRLRPRTSRCTMGQHSLCGGKAHEGWCECQCHKTTEERR